MEELLLRRLLTRDELNIVYQEHVRRAVLLFKGRGHSVSYSLDELVYEGLALLIDDLEIGVVLLHMVHYRIEKMRLTESRVTVYEEGVVIARLVCYRVARRLRKLI